MATQLSTLTQTALASAERALRLHVTDAHTDEAGEAHPDFECVLCHALFTTVGACKEAWHATDSAIIARETYKN